MEKSHTVFLARDRVPNRLALHDALTALRFRLKVDESYVPFKCDGYLPCTLDGEDAGVEIAFSDGATWLAAQPQLLQLLGDRDTAIQLRWGGDPRERASGLMLGVAFADGFGALVRRGGEEQFRAVDRLVKEAREVFIRLQEGYGAASGSKP